MHIYGNMIKGKRKKGVNKLKMLSNLCLKIAVEYTK